MPMLRRKLGSTVQVGLRIREELRRRLEAAAEEHHLSFNQELTMRLEASLEQEARQSLDSAAESLTRHASRLEKLAEAVVERLGAVAPPPGQSAPKSFVREAKDEGDAS
jgi:vacuolar-type H+-ATPase subunit E/Vma4